MSLTTGGCLCGAVRFRAGALADHMEACHCGMCLRRGGGPMLAVEAGDVTFEDDAALVRYASSDWAERGFCARCGSNLFYRMVSTPDRYMLARGSLDDRDGIELTGEIFVDHKPAGYAFAGDHPRETEAETLARFGVVPPPD